jgi:hypothetical protein
MNFVIGIRELIPLYLLHEALQVGLAVKSAILAFRPDTAAVTSPSEQAIRTLYFSGIVPAAPQLAGLLTREDAAQDM